MKMIRNSLTNQNHNCLDIGQTIAIEYYKYSPIQDSFHEKKANTMIKKSDSMLQHEKWIEETMKHRPKHSREGLPIQPIHGLFFLCAVLLVLVVVGSLLHH